MGEELGEKFEELGEGKWRYGLSFGWGMVYMFTFLRQISIFCSNA